MKNLFILVHVLVSLLFASILLSVQSFGLSRFETHWLNWDLVAIYVFYVGIEHHSFRALIKILIVSLLFESVSAVPAGFCVMAHLIMMFVGNRLAVWLEMEHRVAQVTLLGYLLVVKEALFLSTLAALPDSAALSELALDRLPGLLTTLVVAVPLLEFLAWIDTCFDARLEGDSGLGVAARSVRV